MFDFTLPQTILDSLHLHPVFFYIFVLTIVIYMCTEIFLLVSKIASKNKLQKPFPSEFFWIMVPAIFIISLVYAL